MRNFYKRALLFVIVFTVLFPGILISGEADLVQPFPNVTLNRPVDLQNAGDGTDRLFVVTLGGTIYVFENDPAVTDPDVFLTISDRVRSGGELGLLGLAFQSDYENNGYFYVYYTADDPLRSVVSRFEVSDDDPDSADPESEKIILEFNQPRTNHNAGQLAFGPDGYLYIASGDGGGAGDPDDNAQDKTNLLGAILRIDVDNTTGDRNYSIPGDNPFAGNDGEYREEIFAYGLRNPWRMSFDHETGWLWCADVGQQGWEIIHLIENGKNYGWNIIEGSHCYPPGTECDKTGLEMPLFEYQWLGHGSAITGGYVYRGSDLPDLYGKYVYADHGFGTMWALSYDGESEPVNEELIDSDLRISSFGVDEGGEIYFLDYSTTGSIYTFGSVTSAGNEEQVPSEFTLHQNYPNPFNNETTISFSIPEPEHVTISIYNLIGQKIGTITDTNYDRGEHSVTWGGEGLSSGVYFYRMEAGEYIEIKRMVLLQ